MSRLVFEQILSIKVRTTIQRVRLTKHLVAVIHPTATRCIYALFYHKGIRINKKLANVTSDLDLEILETKAKSLIAQQNAITIGQVFTELMTEQNSLSKNTVRNLASRWNKHLKPHLQHKEITLITKSEIEKLLAYEVQPKGETLTPRLKLHATVILNKIVKHAKKKHYTSHNIMQEVEVNIGKLNKRDRFYSKEEINKIIAWADNYKDTNNSFLRFIMIAIFTGLRKSDICKLE